MTLINVCNHVSFHVAFNIELTLTHLTLVLRIQMTLAHVHTHMSHKVSCNVDIGIRLQMNLVYICNHVSFEVALKSGFPQKFKNTFNDFSMIFHYQKCNFHDNLTHGLQHPVARKLAVRHTMFV